MPPANVMDQDARGNGAGAGNDRNVAVDDGIGIWGLNEKVGGAAGAVEEAEGDTCWKREATVAWTMRVVIASWFIDEIIVSFCID